MLLYGDGSLALTVQQNLFLGKVMHAYNMKCTLHSPCSHGWEVSDGCSIGVALRYLRREITKNLFAKKGNTN